MVEIPVHRFHASNPSSMWADGAELTCFHPLWKQGFSVVDYEGNVYPAEFIKQDELPKGIACRYKWRDAIITIWIK